MSRLHVPSASHPWRRWSRAEFLARQALKPEFKETALYCCKCEGCYTPVRGSAHVCRVPTPDLPT